MATNRTVEGEAGRYHFMRDLGTGGQGKTWLARRERDSVVVVVKQLHFDKVSDWKAVEQFEREINALAALDHPGIPDLIDRVTNEDGLTTAIVQQYFDGHTLAEQRSRGPLSPDRYVKALRELLKVVDYLHNQVPPLIHRDIQPHNIVIDSERARLVDFGVATWSHGGTSTTVGTFGYVPQEQLLGRPVPSSDLYALGMSFLAVANGMQASDFPTDPNTGLVDVEMMLARVPDVAKDALREMTRSGLGQRVASAAAALALLEGRPEPDRALVSASVAPPTKKRTTNRRRPALYAALLALSIVVVQLAVFAVVFDFGSCAGSLHGGPGSLCDGDEVIPFENGQYTGSTSSSGDHYGIGTGADYAYSFHATHNASVTVDTCRGTSFDTEITVFDTTDCEGDQLGPILAENDDACGTGSQVTFRAEEGHDYVMVVDGWSSHHSGSYQLGVQIEERLDDLCVGDQEIRPETATYTGSTIGMGDDYTHVLANDYAFSFVANETQRLEFDTCSNIELDTRLVVYDATGCEPGDLNSLTLLHNMDDQCGIGSRVALDVEEGRRYLLVVEGYNEAYEGNFELGVTAYEPQEPLENPCTGDGQLPFSDQTVHGSTLAAGNDYGEHPAQDYAYRFDAESDARVTLHTCDGTEFDTRLVVYDATGCDENATSAEQLRALALVSQNDDSCGLQSRVAFDAFEGRRYVVVVEGFSESQVGPFSLDMTVEGADQHETTDGMGADRRAALTFVRNHVPELMECHETGLESDPSLTGDVVLGITVEPDGRVSSARIVESELNAPRVEQCILDRARSWKLPQRDAADALSLTQRLTFSAR